MRKPGLILLLPLLATACRLAAPVESATPTPTVEQSCAPDCSPSRFTSQPTLPAVTVTPAPTRLPPSPTRPICHPETEEYCIEEGFFVFALPVAAPGIWVDPTYPYGSTQGGTRVPHHGVEFPAPFGTSVLAAADGTVWYAGDDLQKPLAPWPNFYGNVVILEHILPAVPYGRLYTLYAHLSRLDVRAGQSVRAGDSLGLTGMSGAAVGSHLHFEIRLQAEDYISTLNPELYLQPPAGRGALALRLINGQGKPLSAPLPMQFYPDSGGEAFSIDLQPYANETIHPQGFWQENVGAGNLPAGRYRLTYIYQGKLYERWVVIEAGKLTVVRWQLE